MIEQLLTAVSVEDFMERYYLKLPYVEESASEVFLKLKNDVALEKVISDDSLEVLVVREGKELNSEGNSGRDTWFDAYSRGYALILHEAEKKQRRLSRLAKGFRKDFSARVRVRVAFVPESVSGLGWHYDAEEVFLVALKGKTEFSLQKGLMSPFQAKDSPSGVVPERDRSDPVATTSLSEGKWAYIPAGYWHKEMAIEDSVVLEIGVTAPASVKIYDLLKSHLLASFAWYRRLPVFGDPEPGTTPGEVLSPFKAHK